jgi:putative GTP pyrophosphokinase
MASLDFEAEKQAFRKFHTDNLQALEGAKNSFMELVRALVVDDGTVALSKLEGRVKDREECIEKFNRKYRTGLESAGAAYEIADHITDLIGLRVVCLYEDEIEKIKTIIGRHLEVIDTTDKIASIENTESLFGYKGLHLDVRLNEERRAQPEHRRHADRTFELQIRTIIQDSWSELDHKIKYKKSIPNQLKRRINTLAALFELADHEFLQIRNSTLEQIERAQAEPEEEAADAAPQAGVNQEPVVVHAEADGAPIPAVEQIRARRVASDPLDAFSFLRIAKHFFKQFEFEPHKVDGFTGLLLELAPELTRAEFNGYLRTHLPLVKRYQADYVRDTGREMNPFTLIRHAVFLVDPERFSTILAAAVRERFDDWLKRQELLDADELAAERAPAELVANDPAPSR